MSRRPLLFARGVLYHVIVRWNERQKAFLNDADYRAYLERLGLGRDMATVSSLISRYTERMDHRELRRQVEGLVNIGKN